MAIVNSKQYASELSVFQRRLKELIDRGLTVVEVCYDGEKGDYKVHYSSNQDGDYWCLPSDLEDSARALVERVLNQPAMKGWYEEDGGYGSITLIMSDPIQMIHNHHQKLISYQSTAQYYTTDKEG